MAPTGLRDSLFLIVQLSYLICYSYIWLNLSGTVMFHAGVIRMVVDYLCFGKHGRREDNNFEDGRLDFQIKYGAKH